MCEDGDSACAESSFPVDSLLRVYKTKSAGVPMDEFRVRNCSCVFSECVECKEGDYCITVRAEKMKLRKGSESKEAAKGDLGSPTSEGAPRQLHSRSATSFTFCTKKSVDQIAWIEQFSKTGMRFEREDIGDEAKRAPNFFFLAANDLDTGKRVPFNDLCLGKVCLVVNVASK